MVDERAQGLDVVRAGDQAGLLAGFTDRRRFEGLPGLDGAAGKFDGAASMAAQKDSLLAEEDHTDPDCRVRDRSPGARGRLERRSDREVRR